MTRTRQNMIVTTVRLTNKGDNLAWQIHISDLACETRRTLTTPDRTFRDIVQIGWLRRNAIEYQREDGTTIGTHVFEFAGLSGEYTATTYGTAGMAISRLVSQSRAIPESRLHIIGLDYDGGKVRRYLVRVNPVDADDQHTLVWSLREAHRTAMRNTKGGGDPRAWLERCESIESALNALCSAQVVGCGGLTELFMMRTKRKEAARSVCMTCGNTGEIEWMVSGDAGYDQSETRRCPDCTNHLPANPMGDEVVS